jgi:hypothetical protein
MKSPIFTKKYILFFVSCALCAKAFAGIPTSDPSHWRNAYTAPKWSDLVPGHYPNCISQKDSQGNPVLDTNGNFVCQTDSSGNLLGTSADGSTVVDSDAVEVCKTIGGELPTAQDFLGLGSNIGILPSVLFTVYSSSLEGAFSVRARTFLGEGNEPNSYRTDPRFLEGVRCVTHLIQPSFGTNPANWPNGYVASDGSIWSDILSGHYANCISQKDSQGNPLGASSGVVSCQKDANGNNLGLASDDQSIIDSDAVEACKTIGGELPSTQDFLALGSEYTKLPHYVSDVWSSSTLFQQGWLLFSEVAFGGYFEGSSVSNQSLGISGYDPKNDTIYVRCMSR